MSRLAVVSSRVRLALLVALLGWALPLSAQQRSLPDLVAAYKRSVVLVGSFAMTDSPRFGFKGTGFAVADGHLIVTCAHVINEIPVEGGRQWLVRSLGDTGEWRSHAVKLRALDRPRDLALLEIDGPALPALPLSVGDGIREGTPIALMGFPLGGLLGFSHVTHRGIVSALTQVALPSTNSQQLTERSILALRQGAFEMLQLDATAYPGNSGGPVFSVETGEVVGVLNMTLVRGTKEGAAAHPSGISYAVPIQHVRSMIQSEASPR
jgi:S1-C subfamily serine protease